MPSSLSFSQVLLLSNLYHTKCQITHEVLILKYNEIFDHALHLEVEIGLIFSTLGSICSNC